MSLILIATSEHGALIASAMGAFFIEKKNQVRRSASNRNAWHLMKKKNDHCLKTNLDISKALGYNKSMAPQRKSVSIPIPFRIPWEYQNW